MDRTEHFRGRLWAGDQVLMDHVEGHLKTKPEAEQPQRRVDGALLVPAGGPPQFVEGLRYRLTLIDGRSGHIHLLVKDECEGEAPCASFHGTGTARR